MKVTRRQFLAGTVALPFVVGVAVEVARQIRDSELLVAKPDFSTADMVFRSHEWVAADFCKRCGVPYEAVVDELWPKTCDEPYQYFVTLNPGQVVVIGHV